MSSNLPVIHRSRRGRRGCKLEINIPQQQIHANSKGAGLINEGGVMLSEYGNFFLSGTLFSSLLLSNMKSTVDLNNTFWKFWECTQKY